MSPVRNAKDSNFKKLQFVESHTLFYTRYVYGRYPVTTGPVWDGYTLDTIAQHPENSDNMSQRRALCTITTRATEASASAAVAKASRVPMPKKPGSSVLSRKKKLPGVAYQYKYRYRQLPESLKNQALIMEKNAPLTVPVMPRQPTLTVIGSDRRYPVRRVYCVGSNYRYDCVLPPTDCSSNFFIRQFEVLADLVDCVVYTDTTIVHHSDQSTTV